MQYQDLERWIDIKDVDDGYKISSTGRVGSSKYGDFRILKDYFSGKGYRMVDLRKDGKYKKVYVHRLVAMYFIGTDDISLEVNHKDGNKQNNHVNNLEWVTGVDNMKHAREQLGFKNNRKLTEDDVIHIIELYKSGQYSAKEIAAQYNISYSHIYALSNRRIWKYLNIS